MPHKISWIFVLLVFSRYNITVLCSYDQFDWMGKRRVFEIWKTSIGKTYENPLNEEQRFQIWEQHFHEITNHNDGQNSGLWNFRKGLNQFTDLTFREFERMFLSAVGPRLPAEFLWKSAGNVLDEFDWRTSRWQTEVRYQDHCAAGWAFATVGALEFQHFNMTGENVKLSAQELVDCAPALGCYGGSAFQALSYTIRYGLRTESQYPYEGIKYHCNYEKTKTMPSVQSSTIELVSDVHPKNLKLAISAKGPIIVQIKVTRHFVQYHSGVFHDLTCRDVFQTNHAVLLVGYGTDPFGGPYWLIKNSWGTQWGEKGYMRITQSIEANCGLVTFPVFPVLR